MNSENEYSLRFAIVVLMNYYINDEYIDYVISYLSNINSNYYYVNMAVAWALSVAFIKYEEKVMPLIENSLLSNEVHNKTISKINDSLRVQKDTKKYLKSLKK